MKPEKENGTAPGSQEPKAQAPRRMRRWQIAIVISVAILSYYGAKNMGTCWRLSGGFWDGFVECVLKGRGFFGATETAYQNCVRITSDYGPDWKVECGHDGVAIITPLKPDAVVPEAHRDNTIIFRPRQ